MQPNKSQPHNTELELQVLGACLTFPEACAYAIENLRPEDFYSRRHDELFAAIVAVAKAHGPQLDPVMVRAACTGKPNALQVFDALDIGLVIALEIERSCSALRALSDARRLVRAAFEVAAAGLESAASADPGAYLDGAHKKLGEALRERDTSVQAHTIGDLCNVLASELDVVGQPPARRVPAPLMALERMLGGWEAGRLYVVAARPGMGKTALGLLAAEVAGENGVRALVYSLEMDPAELRDRVVSGRAGVDGRLVQRRNLCPSDHARAVRAMGELSGMPIEVVDAAGLKLEQICRHARREHMRAPIGLIVVDYLQLLRSGQKHNSREEEVSSLSRELKLLARQLCVPVIAVAQLNRDVEKRADKRPLLSDLRESGAIEQDADAIVFIYRDDYYDHASRTPGACELIVAKNRSGEVGIVRARFEARTTRFKDASAPC